MKRTIAFFTLVSLFMGLSWAAGSTEAASRAEGGLISPDAAKRLLDSDSSVVLIDVRTDAEYADGHIPNARLLPYDAITAESAAAVVPPKKTQVVVYCRTGRRSGIAAKSLRDLGYATVWDLGGIVSWPYEVER